MSFHQRLFTAWDGGIDSLPDVKKPSVVQEVKVENLIPVVLHDGIQTLMRKNLGYT